MERILTEKVNWLAAHGYDVTIVTTEQMGRSPFFELAPAVKLVNFDIGFNSHVESNLLSKVVKHYVKLRGYKKRLVEQVRRERYDIVISLGGKELEFLADMKVDSRKIAEVHFSQKYKEQFINSRTKSKIHCVLGKWLTHKYVKSTKRLDKLVVLTKEDEQVWLKSNHNVSQIYNFIDDKIITEVPPVRKSRSCIAVGRLDEQKGFDMLVMIWEVVNARYPDWILEIYGTGKWEKMLTNEINRRGLSGKILIKGQTRDVYGKLVGSEIFLMTSRYEGFPMVLLEAEAAGLPIVSFDCPTGPREIVADNDNGYLVALGDINGFADKVIELIEDVEQRRRFGQRSLQLIRRFDKEQIMRQWCALFDEFMRTRSTN